MPDVTITLKGDLHFNERARNLLAAGLMCPGSSAPLDAMFRQWADFYADWSRRRFANLSRSGGGGEWPPLALSTLLSRRPFGKGQGKRKITDQRALMRAMARGAEAEGITDISTGAASILWDTGQLFGALSTGAQGNITERGGPSITFGIGGPAQHEARGSVRKAVTIGQLAAYHQEGGGHLPARPILVKPPEGDPIYRRMQRAGNAAVAKVLEQAKSES